jgi:hypothetical protein
VRSGWLKERSGRESYLVSMCFVNNHKTQWYTLQKEIQQITQ